MWHALRHAHRVSLLAQGLPMGKTGRLSPAILSPAFTRYDGISTGWPFTVKCACATNCRLPGAKARSPTGI